MQMKAGVDEADDGVHGVLNSEEDVAELAEEVHVRDVIWRGSESIGILGVRGRGIESSDELAVGVTAEADGVWRGLDMEDASVISTTRWDQPRSRTEKRQK
jgi:hypothetical protein